MCRGEVHHTRQELIVDQLRQLRERQEWKLASVLGRADRPLALAWWLALALRGVLPAAFALTMGVLISAVQHRSNLAGLTLSQGTPA